MVKELSKKEKWKKLKEILQLFGSESEGEKVFVFRNRNDKEKIDQIKLTIEKMINVEVNVAFNDKENRWEIYITNSQE